MTVYMVIYSALGYLCITNRVMERGQINRILINQVGFLNSESYLRRIIHISWPDSNAYAYS